MSCRRHWGVYKSDLREESDVLVARCRNEAQARELARRHNETEAARNYGRLRLACGPPIPLYYASHEVCEAKEATKGATPTWQTLTPLT